MPEQIDLLGAVRRSAYQLLLLSAGVALLAGLIVEATGETYQVHYSYFASLSEREEADDFRFDGFYAIQTTELFVETLAGWMTAPEIIVQAYSAADLPLPGVSPRALTSSVRAVKKAPQMVEVTVVGKDREKTKRLAAGMITVIEAKIAEFQHEAVPALEFNVKASEPWVGEVRLSRPVITGATFVFVFFLGLNLVLLKESFRRYPNAK